MIKRLLFSALCVVATSAMAERPAEDLYGRTCMACHAAGVAGALKTGDTKGWQALIDKKGMDALVESVTRGLNAMPPRGMCFDCTPEEYKALINYMASPK